MLCVLFRISPFFTSPTRRRDRDSRETKRWVTGELEWGYVEVCVEGQTDGTPVGLDLSTEVCDG